VRSIAPLKIFFFADFDMAYTLPTDICMVNQGDQIVRVLAYWVIIFWGQFFENYRSSTHLWASLL
jgi:hypothetical protein